MKNIKILFTLWAVSIATLLMGNSCRAAVSYCHSQVADTEVSQQNTNTQTANHQESDANTANEQKSNAHSANEQERASNTLYDLTPGSLEHIAASAPVGAESLNREYLAVDDKSTEGWAGKWDRLVESIKLEEVRRLILGGLYTTVIIFFFGAIFAILLATLLAYLGITHKCQLLYKPIQWFVVKIRDVPEVILMMFFYYVLFSGKMNGIMVSIIALGVYTAGSLSVTFISAIKKVGQGQIEAGKILGLSVRQCYKHIILPQAVKGILPQIIAALKIHLLATTYAGYVAQKDLVKAVDAIRIYTIDNTIPLIITAILYLFIGWVIAKVITWLYKLLFTYD